MSSGHYLIFHTVIFSAQCIMSLTLLVVSTVLFLQHRRHQLTNSSTNIKLMLPTISSRNYYFHTRLIGWFIQISVMILSSLHIYYMYLQYQHARHPLSYVMNMVYFVDLLVVIVIGNINHIDLQVTNTTRLWLSVYSIIFLHNACFYLFFQSWLELSMLFISFIIVIFATFIAFYDISIKQEHAVPVELTCDLYNYLTFSYLNRVLINPGMKKAALELDDVPELADADSAQQQWQRFKGILKKNKSKKAKKNTTNNRSNSDSNIRRASDGGSTLHLGYSLYELVKIEWYLHGFFQFLSSLTTFIAPLALERILIHISSGDHDDDSAHNVLPITIEVALALLFIGPLANAIAQNQNYMRGRHIGIQVRSALVTAIYQKSLVVDLTATTESIGQLNNLISVDAGEVQSFCAYSHAIWSEALEVVIGCTLLFIVLGTATIGGILVMFVCIIVGLYLSKLCEKYQETLMKSKDSRMSIISEVLNSIRIIKYYAWELKFIGKIKESRRIELVSLRSLVTVGGLMYLLWELVPAFVGLTAFVIHTYALGRPLTPAIGFTALTLFNILRYPLNSLPEMISFLIRTRVSLRRIETFLNTPNVKGIANNPPIPQPSNSNQVHVRGHRIINTASSPMMILPNYSKQTQSSCNPNNNNNNVGGIEVVDLTFGWLPTLKVNNDDKNKISNAKNNTVSVVGGDDGYQQQRNCCNIFRCCSNEASTQSKKHFGAATSTSTMNINNNKAPSSDISNNALTYTLLDEDDEEYNYMHDDSSHPLYSVEMGNMSSSSGSINGQSSSNNSSSISKSMMMSDNDFGHHDSLHNPIALNMEQSLPEDVKFNGTIVIEHTSFSIPPKSLAIIVGVTGSGKSSLLHGAFLGEGVHVDGCVSIGGRLSYAPQSPWIQNATLRDNILFGSAYDKERYDRVVYCCSLVSDFKLLPAGDMTEIGEKGVNLSGGQQQRVSLARAAYASSDVILLDDCLSAVDSVVGEHIFRELVVGFLSDRTRVLVTHNLSLTVPSADLIICLDAVVKCYSDDGASRSSGSLSNINNNDIIDTSNKSIRSSANNSYSRARSRVITCCKPSDIPGALQRITTFDSADTKGFLTNLMHACTIQPNSNTSSSMPLMPSASSSVSSSPTTAYKNCSYDSLTNAVKFNNNYNNNTNSNSDKNSSVANKGKYNDNGTQVAVAVAVADAVDVDVNNGIDAMGSSYKSITEKETKSEGDIGFDLYWYYMKACGGVPAAMGLILGTIALVLAGLYQNIASGEWMSAMESGDIKSSKRFFYNYLFSIFVLLLSTCVSIASEVISNLNSSSKMHELLTTSVMLSLCGWFDATPIGRIVNRFSQDISTIDSGLINALYGFARCVLETLLIIGVITFSLPYLLLAFVPIILFTMWVSYQYLHISRELKRLESLMKSPVFVLFSETLQGLAVVRSFRAEKRFFSLCCERSDNMNRCHLYMWLCNRWLNFRMQILGAMVTGVVGLTIVLHLSSIGNTLAAVVMIYSLSFCDALTWLARTHADCQMNLNSVERLKEYSNLESESYMPNHYDQSMKNEHQGKSATTITDISLLSNSTNNSNSASMMMTSGKWPKDGRIEFKNLSMKYASSADAVLKRISFVVPSKSKMGVVGRTGAGKSSIVAALFRICEPYEGELIIDGINVLQAPLHVLRNAIAIVPQDPTLFRGSVRFNLDPFDQFTDDEILTALRRVHLLDHIYNMEDDPNYSGGAEGGGGGGDNTSDESSHGGGIRGKDDSFDGKQNNTVITVSDSVLERKQVAEKGANFSVGQRQLLCLARAMLRKASILVLDECTASVDHETDALIQETIRNDLKDCTVLCIAHRLHTIAYYDHVIVMDQGRLAECDEPYVLINQMDSIFRQMCITSGDFDELYATAEKSFLEKKTQSGKSRKF